MDNPFAWNDTIRQLNAMRNAGMDETEIADILETDKRIDRGEKLFELPDELKAGAKKARQADRKQTAPTKRERKPDTTKQGIIQTLIDVLSVNSGCSHWADTGSIEILNPEREFSFTVDGKKYKIVLSAPRS